MTTVLEPRVAGPEKLLDAATTILRAGRERGLTIRVAGSVAFWLRCPTGRHLRARTGRLPKDLDLVAPLREKGRVEALLRDLGFREDGRIATIPGVGRSLFHAPGGAFGCDVFYDTLEFCHRIDLRGRLHLDDPTIPLVDLLLQKLQIVELVPTDVCDVQMLLLEYPPGPIDADRLAAACGRDWGLWQTVTTNLAAVRTATAADATIDGREVIVNRIDALRTAIDRAPKGWRWRLRAVVGVRVRWYDPVEGLSRV